MKKLFVFTLALSFTFFSFAQRGGTDRYGNIDVAPLFEDLMLPSAGGTFRGVSFDMSKSKVKTIEEGRSTVSIYKDEIPEELVVTTDMGDDVMNFADITYKFDEKGLYSIYVESYAVSNESADGVYDEVVKYFEKKFGSGKMADDDYLEFKGKSGSYSYTVAIQNIEYEDSPGLYMYIYLE